jgi:hypothetical protein
VLGSFSLPNMEMYKLGCDTNSTSFKVEKMHLKKVNENI